MANNIQDSKAKAEYVDRFPLSVLFCSNCGLSQLSIIVDPVVLFTNYVYRSGINNGYVNHCRQMAKELQVKHVLDKSSVIYDIAGNDGTLLKQFSEVIGCHQVVNIDPAKNLWQTCEKENGVRMYCFFWGTDTAKMMLQHNNSLADVITATNVFAHVHDVKDFIIAAELMLKPNGILVLEFPYLIDFIEKKEFDTVYFEHLSYFSITPLMWLVTDCGMKIVSVSKQDIHGGTVRVTIAKQWADIPVEQSVDDFVMQEEAQGFISLSKYADFSDTVSSTVAKFRDGLSSLPGTVAAFAASAKGNTLLNCVGDCSPIQYIVDETPEKIGKFAPGVGIEIVPLVHLLAFPVDYLVILSWNFADEIMSKCRAAGYTGKFIIPIPEWRIIS